MEGGGRHIENNVRNKGFSTGCPVVKLTKKVGDPHTKSDVQSTDVAIWGANPPPPPGSNLAQKKYKFSLDRNFPI